MVHTLGTDRKRDQAVAATLSPGLRTHDTFFELV